jgi:hypothetical protein
VTYNLGNWGFSLADRFYTKFNRSTNPGLQFYAIPYGSSINIMDVNIDRKLEVDGSALDIYFNIKNFLNAAPPIVPSNGTSIGGSPYGEHLSNSGGGGVIGADDVGRVFTIGVRANL